MSDRVVIIIGLAVVFLVLALGREKKASTAATVVDVAETAVEAAAD